jgi:CubicO group peptidase (beta-lactamase class C family)
MAKPIAGDFSTRNELKEFAPASSEQEKAVKAIWKESAQQIGAESVKSESQINLIKIGVPGSSPASFPITPFIAALQELHQSGQMQGVVVVSKGDLLVYQNASGAAFANSSSSLGMHSQFYIGSVSKQFTAAALLKALYLKNHSVERLKAALQNPMSQYLPENHPIWGDQMPQWASQITLHQLLTHTSGIPNFTDEEKFQNQFYQESHTPKEIMDLIKDKNLEFQPGTKPDYSNTNYFLLAEIVTAISKQPFDQFLSQQFFQPLSMTSTHHPLKGNLKELQTQDHLKNLSDALETNSYIDLSHAQGCGSIISTVGDLLKWNRALHIDHSVLPKEIYSLMVADYTSGLVEEDDESEGYGIGTENHSFGKIYGYNGRLDTFNSLLLFAPQDQVSVVILTNSDQGQDSFMNAIGNILK